MYIKLFAIRCFLILGILIYLLSPLKNSVFNFLHFISHNLVFFLEDGANEPVHHSHDFQSVNRFTYHHDHGSNSNHTHSTNNFNHQHSTLFFIASFFIPLENKEATGEKLLPNTKLDEHLFSEIFNFHLITSTTFEKKEWCLNSTSYFISLDITTPPPQIS